MAEVLRTYGDVQDAGKTLLDASYKGIDTGIIIAELLSKAANGNPFAMKSLRETLANEHPTLLGQIAKVVAEAVAMRVTRDPEWKPFDKVASDGGTCHENITGKTVRLGQYGDAVELPIHAYHDGRLTCETVIGAELMARQPVI